MAWLSFGLALQKCPVQFIFFWGSVLCLYVVGLLFFFSIFPIFFLFTYFFIHILNKIEVYCFYLVSSSDEQILTGQNNLSPIKLFEMSALSIGNWLTKMMLKILLKTVKSTLVKLTTNFTERSHNQLQMHLDRKCAPTYLALSVLPRIPLA